MSFRQLASIFTTSRRSIALVVLLIVTASAQAQYIPDARKRKLPNLPGYDYKRIHFGFLVGLNVLDFHIYNSGARTAENGYTARYGEILDLNPGINLGIITDLRLYDNLNLRCLPGISFGERDITFIDENGNILDDNPLLVKSTFIDIPFLLKYSAKRINNWRPYIVGGNSLRYDLAKEKQNHLKLRSLDAYCDLGAGLDFYLPYFRLSVELRAAFGLTNIFNTTKSEELEDLVYQQAVDKLKSRWYGLTFYFE